MSECKLTAVNKKLIPQQDVPAARLHGIFQEVPSPSYQPATNTVCYLCGSLSVLSHFAYLIILHLVAVLLSIKWPAQHSWIVATSDAAYVVSSPYTCITELLLWNIYG